MHHGPVMIDYMFSRAVDEILAWQKRQTKYTKNVLFIGISEGSDYVSKIKHILSIRNMTLIENCSCLESKFSIFL